MLNGQLGGQDGGFDFISIKVGYEIDGIELYVSQEGVVREGSEAALGVSHGGGGVGVDGTEIAVSVNEGCVGGESLRESDEGVVDGRISMGVVLAQDFADDPSALAVSPAGGEVESAHGVEDAAVDGLESIAGVGEGPSQYDGEGVLHEGVFDFGGKFGGWGLAGEEVVGRLELLGFGGVWLGGVVGSCLVGEAAGDVGGVYF